MHIFNGFLFLFLFYERIFMFVQLVTDVPMKRNDIFKLRGIFCNTSFFFYFNFALFQLLFKHTIFFHFFVIFFYDLLYVTHSLPPYFEYVLSISSLFSICFKFAYICFACSDFFICYL